MFLKDSAKGDQAITLCFTYWMLLVYETCDEKLFILERGDVVEAM